MSIGKFDTEAWRPLVGSLGSGTSRESTYLTSEAATIGTIT